MLAVGVDLERAIGADLDLGAAQNGDHVQFSTWVPLNTFGQVTQEAQLAFLAGHDHVEQPVVELRVGAISMPPPKALLLATATE